MLNNQIPMKVDHREDGKILVHSIFPTIQGEGPLTGRPAIFLRLAGCNLQCPGCDTEYTDSARLMDADEIYDEICYHISNFPGTDTVVITGGEPLRQDINPIAWYLIQRDLTVQLETNGTLFLENLPYGSPRFMVGCSPKAKVNPKLKPVIDYLKYVVKDGDIDDDGLPIHALDHPVAKTVEKPWPKFNGSIYVQPMDEQDEELNHQNLAAAINSCQQHGYTLCIQTHKVINME